MQESLPTFYWHDYETWGEVPAQDRPSQFAGVRTDLDLNVVGEPLMIYCKPSPDTLPKPEACLITGLVPQVAMAKGLPEHQFAAAIHRELSCPNTCGAGYNSLRFDDEVTRFMLYRNFYDPYEREWRNGNSRWDLIDVVRMTRALRPDGINWPNYDDGKPCFKLEMLTTANHLIHEAAHDALSDVYATIALAKLIKTKQPRLFDYAFRLRDKRFVASLIDIANAKPLLHISSRFSAENGNAALVLPLAMHPTNRNAVIAYNLSFDPSDLLSLPVDQLRERLYTRQEELPEGVARIALKEIHLNRSPMLLAPNMLDAHTAKRLRIDRSVCESHWQQLKSLPPSQQVQLQHRLCELYSDAGFAERTDPDQMLYSGFFSDVDKRLMAQVRRASPQTLAGTTYAFEDPRLPELLFRYRARNFPDSLRPEEQGQWQAFCRHRLSDPSGAAGLDLTTFQNRLAQLSEREPLTSAQQQIIQLLHIYANDLARQFSLVTTT